MYYKIVTNLKFLVAIHNIWLPMVTKITKFPALNSICYIGRTYMAKKARKANSEPNRFMRPERTDGQILC